MTASIQQKLTDHKDLILKRYDKTKSCRIVAEELGVGMVTIWKFVKQNSDLCKRRRLTEEQENELAKDYVGGMSAEKVGEKYGVSYTVARDYLIRTKTKLKTNKDYRKHIFNQKFFKENLAESHLWFLGWVYSDGNVTQNKRRISVVVHRRDKEVLGKMEKLIEGDKLVIDVNNRNISALYMFSTDMAEDLIKLGCVPAKSLIIKYPKFLNTKEQNLWFLRGVFEGDGHISLKHKNRGANAEIASGSLEFLQDIRAFLKLELGIESKIYEKANSNGKRVVIAGGIKQVERFMDALYSNASPNCRMDRKYNVYLELKRACAALEAEK